MSGLLSILFLFSLLGYCFAARRWLRVPLEFTPFFSISSLIVLLYCSAYLGSLRYGPRLMPIGFNAATVPEIPLLLYGAWGLFLLGLTCLIFMVAVSPESRKACFEDATHPAIAVFFGIALLIAFPIRYNVIRKIDEFNHWGIAAKALFYHNAFEGSDSPLFFPSYPHISALFHYYTAKIGDPSGAFLEGMCYGSIALMYLSAIVALTCGTYGKKRLAMPAVLTAGFASLFLFQKGLICLYVDALLSVWFGTILFIYFSGILEQVPLLQRTVRIIPPLLVLTLLKQIGIFFTGTILLVVFGDVLLAGLMQLWKRRTKRLPDESGLRPPGHPGVLSTFLVLGFLLAAPLLFWKSWSFRLESIGLSNRFGQDRLIDRTWEMLHSIGKEVPPSRWPVALFDREQYEKLRDAVEHSLKDWQIETLKKGGRFLLVGGLTRIRVGHSELMSSTSFALLITLFSFAALRLRRAEGFRGRFVLLWFLLSLGFAAYIGLLLSTYLFTFGKGGALALLGFDRYLGTYVHGWTFFWIGLYPFLVRSPQNMKNASDIKSSIPAGERNDVVSIFDWDRRQALWIILFAMAVAAASSERLFVRHASIAHRERIVSIIRQAESSLEGKRRIWLVVSNDEEQLDFCIIKHEMLPTWFTQPESRLPRNDSDGAWSRQLQAGKFDAVFLVRTNDRFWDIFGGMFASERSSCHVWDVVCSADGFQGHVKLVPSEPTMEGGVEKTGKSIKMRPLPRQ